MSRTTVAALVLGLAAVGCSSPSTSGAGAARTASADHSDHAAHEQEADGDPHQHDEEAGHGAGHHHDAESAALLTPADLPAGYRSGHAHEPPDLGGAPPVGAACAPLARILRTDDGHAGAAKHPRSTAVFTKSHFGPTITETVVDYHGFEAAAVAIGETRAARKQCERYVHSSSQIGANTYQVQELRVPRGSEPGVYLRLDAVGADFEGIHWDVWVHDCDGKLVSVTHRSAKNGNNNDFWPAVAAAMAKQHPA